MSAAVDIQSSVTFFSHADSEALLQSTVATLITFVLVDAATALIATRVDVFLANRTSEEAFTTVARFGAVVFAGGAVVADGTLGTHASTDRQRPAVEAGTSTGLS